MNEFLDLLGNLKDCTWSHWTPATLHFCEAHLCERIVAPAETWSNLAYLFVGLYLLFHGLRSSERRGLAEVRVRFGLYALIVAISSSLFHASYTYVFETVDLAAMNFLGVELVLQGLRRLEWLKGRSPVALGIVLFLAGLVLLLGTENTGRLWVFGAFVAVTLWLEALIFVRGRRLGTNHSYRALGASLGLFFVAYVFWMLDYTGTVCVPDRHWFSGHAAWHVLNAGCFLTLSSFYRSR